MYSIDPNLLLSMGQPPHPYSFLLRPPRGLLLAPSSFLSTSTAQLTPPHYFLSSLSMLYFPSCLLPSSRGPSPIPSRFHLLHAAFLPPTSAQLQIKIYFLLNKSHSVFSFPLNLLLPDRSCLIFPLPRGLSCSHPPSPGPPHILNLFKIPPYYQTHLLTFLPS